MGGVIGSLQAMEAIKYIIGKGELLTGRLLTYDALSMTCLLYTSDNEKCNYCGRCAKSCPVDAWDVNEAFLVSFGGTFGNHISKGREFLPLITSEEQLFRVTDAAIQFFADHANAGERFKFTIDRVGEEKLYEVLKGAYDG